MKIYAERLLKTFDYHSWTDWANSMFPSLKYNPVTYMTVCASSLISIVEIMFGMDWLAFAGFIVIMIIELVSGIKASQIRKEPFSSMRLSRFGFKLSYYLVLISVPYLFATSYRAHGKELVASAFDWMHIFIVMQVVLENIVSILENAAVIDGKDKTIWIKKLQEKFNAFLS